MRRRRATLPEQNGALIRQEESLFYLDPIRLIEHDADVTRIMYRTTDQAGEARAAVATGLEPSRDRSQDDEVIVQAPGTQGMGDHCAPSRQLSAGSEYEGISIAASLEAGYTVVVPDYIGLGTESEHTYMDREDQAHAVLDAARASRQAEGVGLDEESKFHLRGYSQGGGAAAALEKQRIGQGRAPEVRVQLNHSRLDDVIPHTVGHDLASRWCEGGSRVTFRSTVAPTHIGGYAGGLPGVALFTARTMDGSTPLSSCWRL